jgi:hypothetical protein
MNQNKKKFYLFNGMLALISFCFIIVFLFVFTQKESTSRQVASKSKTK